MNWSLRSSISTLSQCGHRPTSKVDAIYSWPSTEARQMNRTVECEQILPRGGFEPGDRPVNHRVDQAGIAFETICTAAQSFRDAIVV